MSPFRVENLKRKQLGLPKLSREEHAALVAAQAAADAAEVVEPETPTETASTGTGRTPIVRRNPDATLAHAPTQAELRKRARRKESA